MLVSSGSRALQRLLERVGGEDPEDDGHPGRQLHLLDPRGALARHEVVVARVAADDGTEAQHGVHLAGVGEGPGDQRQLEGARRPGHRDVPAVGPGLVERLEGSVEQPQRDAAVELGAGDADPQPGAVVPCRAGWRRRGDATSSSASSGSATRSDSAIRR